MIQEHPDLAGNYIRWLRIQLPGWNHPFVSLHGTHRLLDRVTTLDSTPYMRAHMLLAHLETLQSVEAEFCKLL